jgi:2,3-bisphosphoglycerate-dependent phosphoglycerate mutase
MAEVDTIEPEVQDEPVTPPDDGGGPKPKGSWLDDLNDYLTKKPGASDKELFDKFPQLGNSSDKLDNATGYLLGKHKGMPDDQLSKMFPDLVPPSATANPMNRQAPRGTPVETPPPATTGVTAPATPAPSVSQAKAAIQTARGISAPTMDKEVSKNPAVKPFAKLEQAINDNISTGKMLDYAQSGTSPQQQAMGMVPVVGAGALPPDMNESVQLQKELPQLQAQQAEIKQTLAQEQAANSGTFKDITTDFLKNADQFFTKDGVLDYGKVLDYANQKSAEYGGGRAVGEQLYNILAPAAKFQKIKPDVDKEFQTLTGKAPADYLASANPEIAKEVTAVQAQAQTDYEAEARRSQDLINQKATETFQQKYQGPLDHLAGMYGANSPQVQQATDSIKALMADDLRTFQTSENARLLRLRQEKQALIDAEVKKAQGSIGQDHLDAFNRTYSQAYQNVQTRQQAAGEAAVGAMPSFNAMGLFGRAMWSGLNGWMASRGAGLVAAGFNNPVTDWMRGRQTSQEANNVPDLPLSGANLLNPTTYATRAGKMLGGMLPDVAATILLKNPMLGGLEFTGSSTVSGMGEVYNQAKAEGADEATAQKKAQDFGYANFIATLPANLLMSSAIAANVKGVGGAALNITKEAAGGLGAALPQQYLQQAQGANGKPLGQFLEEDAPHAAIENLIGLAAGAGIMRGVGGLVKGMMDAHADAATEQHYSQLLDTKGTAYAYSLAELKYLNGVIDAPGLAKEKAMIDGLIRTKAGLTDMGATGDQHKLYFDATTDINRLKAQAEAAPDDILRGIINGQIKDKENFAKDVIAGNAPYIKITTDSGTEFALPVDKGIKTLQNPDLQADIAAGHTKVQLFGKPEEVTPAQELLDNIQGKNVAPEAQIPGTPQITEVRHAITAEDDKGVTSGPTDINLNAEGRGQADQLGQDLQGRGITRVVGSETPRNVETAQRVAQALGVPAEQVEGLNAWKIGDFDKMPDTEFKAAEKYFVNNPDDTEFEGKKLDESFNQYKDRVIQARQQLEDENQGHTLLVNHGGNINIWDAFQKNGEWNDQAAKDYLQAKDTPPATLPETIPEASAASEPTLPGRTAEFSDFYHNFKDEVRNIPDSSFDFRVDMPQSQADREGAVKDIDAGKDSKRAKLFLDELQKQYENGTIEYTRGRGNHVEKFGIPVDDWIKVNQEAQERVVSEDIEGGQIPNEELAKWLSEEADKTYEHGTDTPSDTGSTSNGRETGDQTAERVPAVRTGDAPETGDRQNPGKDEPRPADNSAQGAVREVGAAKGDQSVPELSGEESDDRALRTDLANRLGKKDKMGGDVPVGDAPHTEDQYLSKAKAVLHQLFPDHDIRVYDTEADYMKGEGRPKGSAGVYDPTGKYIAFNMEAIRRAGAENTIFHEVIHPIVQEALQSRPGAVDAAYSKLVELRDVPGMENVWSHEEAYRGRGLDTMKVEAITEFLTHVADGRIDPENFKTSFKTKIIDVVNRIFKALGIDKVISTAQDIRRLADSIKSAFDEADAKPVEEALGRKPESTGGDKMDKFIGSPTGDPKEDFVREKLDGFKESSVKKALVETGGMKDVDAQALIDKVRAERTMSPEDIIKEAQAIGKSAAAKNQIAQPLAAQAMKSGMMKTARRWYYDGVDEVSDVKSIIRKNKGKEEFEINKLYHETRKLVNWWNGVPEAKQMAFILGVEKPELLNNQNQHIKDIADQYRQRLDKVHDLIKQAMPDINFIQDYFPHFWEKPDQAAKVFAESLAKAPLEGSKSFAKQRFYDTIVEGLKAGLKLATTNPEEMVRLAEANAWKFKTARAIFDDMKAKGYLKFSTGKDVPADWQSVDDKLFNRMGAYVDKNGEANLALGSYKMPPDVAKLMNDYLSLGIKGPVKKFIQQYNNIKNLFQLGVGFFHFSTTSLDSIVTGMTNGIQKLSAGKVGGVLDLATLGNLPATLARGFKAVSDYNTGKLTADTQALMDANARVGKQKMYSIDAAYNMKKAFGKLRADGDFKQIPKVLWNGMLYLPEAINKPLMEHWVPALKVGGYLRSLDSELSVRKNMTPEQLQNAKQKIWDSMDDRLGQVVYDNVFMNKAAKDLGFLAIRSAGWTGGTIRAVSGGVAELPRSAGRLLQGQGLSQRTAYLAALPLTVGMMGAFYQYVMTGKKPEEMKDYFFPKDGTQNPDGTDHRTALPSYMKDILAYGKSPVKTLANKTAPIWNELLDIYYNKDFYGEKVYNGDDPIYQKGVDVLKYEAESMEPFSFKKNPNQTSLPATQQIEQKFGIMPAPKEREQTDLQNSIVKAYGDQMGHEEEGKTHAEMEQSIARRHLKDFLYSGGSYADASDEWKTAAAISPRALGKFIHDAKTDPFENYYKALKPATKSKLWQQMSDEDKEKYGKYTPANLREPQTPSE